MNNTKTVSIVALCLFVIAVLACNATTANISSFKLAKDKEGKNAASDFKSGEAIYGLAQISNNGGKVKVKFRLVADNVKGMNAGETVKGSETTVDLEGDGVATYTLTTQAGSPPGGSYKVVAEMLYNDEKKDEKSASFKLAGAETGSPTESEKEPEGEK
jgi:hypothetical protein